MTTVTSSDLGLTVQQFRKYRQALRTGKINVVGVSSTRNGWVGFRLFTQDDSTQIVVKQSAYWSKSKGFYHCVAWGTDRRLEVVLSVGYTLGLQFNEISQQYRWLSWES